MKLPIDQMCATTGALCANCQRLVREGKVSHEEVEISKLIVRMVGKNKKYRDLEFIKMIRVSQGAILVIKKGQKDLWTDRNLGLLNAISDMLGTDIILIEKIKNPKQLIETLIAPATPKEITKMFIPPFGEEEYVIKIAQSQKPLVKFSSSELAEIVKSMTGASAYITYE